MAKAFETKSSGSSQKFETGMVRDTQEGKPRFDLIAPKRLPYRDQMMTRWAALMGRGAEHYGDRNWEKASTQAELDRAMAAVERHFWQWKCGEVDEDHASAVFFNIQAVEYIKWRMDHPDDNPSE